ncbi:MAG: flagellar M-ring protein FliF [Acidobacteriia bacterium]|nr:flagellar M-ring protein FliF [Terriglobia bacterium]
MPGTQPSLQNQLLAIWSRLQATQRATLLLSTVLALVGLGSLVFFMNRVEYVALYRDLNPEDAQAIVGKLKELKKDYQVSADQSTIEVAGSEADLNKLRMDIEGAGLRHSGRIGYEIFDKSQFGMTDFTEQVNYKRALEGELGRTINSLAEITEARVHLVLPKDSLFEEKKEEAKASVFVRLRKGKELPKSSISGIVNLVAGAVQGLPTYNVSVVDSEGRVLSRLPSGEGTRSEYESGVQAQIEKDMVAKVTSMLEPVVGKGKVHANASVDVDFNSSEQTEETFSPTPPPVILSHQKSEEKVGSANTPAGVPGTRSNQGGVAAVVVPGAPDRSRQSEVTNYEVSKLVRHTVQPKGSIQRVSLAVLLDYKTVYSKAADGKQAATFAPHTKEELDTYRKLVLATIGYNDKRGDTVTLENMPFFTEPALEEDGKPLPLYIRYQYYLIPAMKYAAYLVLFLLAYLLLVRPVRKRIFQGIASAAPALTPGQPRQLGESGGKAQALPAGAPLNAAAALPGQIPTATAGSLEADIEQELLKETEAAGADFRKYDVLKKRVVEHANKDPEQVSQLVRAWIHEKS